ncbi:MAG TPA: nitroreductase family protein [Acidimicrobiia bacterium]
MSDFFDVAARQRAHRAFTDEPVADATIVQLLDAAVRAPSAENRQPWEFVVVRDADVRARIADLMARAWDGGGREYSQDRLSKTVLADVEVAMHGGFAVAPVFIVVCGDVHRSHENAMQSSVFPAVQNLLLGATALGLGSALTTIATVFGKELRTLLALPKHVRPLAVVPLGHPAKQLGPSKREPATTHMHRDHYGTPWSGGAS